MLYGQRFIWYLGLAIWGEVKVTAKVGRTEMGGLIFLLGEFGKGVGKCALSG